MQFLARLVHQRAVDGSLPLAIHLYVALVVGLSVEYEPRITIIKLIGIIRGSTRFLVGRVRIVIGISSRFVIYALTLCVVVVIVSIWRVGVRVIIIGIWRISGILHESPSIIIS